MRLKEKKECRICLTFDTEELTLPEECGLGAMYNRATEFSREGVARLIKVMEEFDAKATFFTTGFFAEREPEAVKILDSYGHEIGCHGPNNTNLTKYTKENLSRHISDTTKLLSSLIRKEISGFRAPMYFINKDIIDIVYDQGYSYDSSVHPAIVPGRYYNYKLPLDPYFLRVNGVGKQSQKLLLELPIAVIPIIRFPISWWWMRNIGAWLTVSGTKINLMQKRDVILYFHPWEFADLPFINGLPRHYTHKCGTPFLQMIREFIKTFHRMHNFTTLKSLSREYL